MVAAAAPAGIIAALFAILFILAWQQFGGELVHALSIDLPLIGNVIGNLIAKGLEIAYGGTLYWLDAAVAPLANFIDSLVTAPLALFNATITLAETTYHTVDNIVNKQLPTLVGNVLGYSNVISAQVASAAAAALGQVSNTLSAAITSVENDAKSWFTQSITYAQQVAGAVSVDAHNLFAATENDLARLGANLTNLIEVGVADAEAYTLKAYQSATGYALTLAGQAESDIASALTHAEQFAVTTTTNAIGALVTDIDNTIGAALGGIYTDVDQAIADVIGVAGTADADVIAAIKAIPTSIPLDLAGLATLAGASTLALTRFLRDCGIPNCQNLSQFGKDLQGLLAIANSAVFLELIVQLIRDPGDAAATLDNAFGDTIGAGIAEVRSLIGI